MDSVEIDNVFFKTLNESEKKVPWAILKEYETNCSSLTKDLAKQNVNEENRVKQFIGRKQAEIFQKEEETWLLLNMLQV